MMWSHAYSLQTLYNPIFLKRVCCFYCGDTVLRLHKKVFRWIELWGRALFMKTVICSNSLISEEMGKWSVRPIRGYHFASYASWGMSACRPIPSIPPAVEKVFQIKIRKQHLLSYCTSLVSYSNCIFILFHSQEICTCLSLKICTCHQLMYVIQDRDFERLNSVGLYDELSLPFWISLAIKFCTDVLLKCPCMVSSAFSSMTPYALLLIWSHFFSALRKSSLWPGFPLWNDFSIKYLFFSHWREVDFEVSYLPQVPTWTETWDINT